ncbi:Ig-like domain repeat protein [Solirubrobacter soli]|uniref:Ig-like domain repeat protein n=1 Tax=Solirubrobacter soli TaxID=363832 RepID=UPI00040B4B1E|nr:Ig-like domain repeat protein [Solirubrobacter soli]
MRTFGAAFAAVLTTLGIVTAPAFAGLPSTTVGTADLTTATNTLATGPAIFARVKNEDGTSGGMPFAGRIISFKLRMASCPSTCHARLLALRPTTPHAYDVIAASPPAVVSAGLNTVVTSLGLQAGDVLGLELDDGVVDADSNWSQVEYDLDVATGGGASSVTLPYGFGGVSLMFNAQLVVPVATTLALEAPASATAGDPITYRFRVDRATGSDRSVIGGTVSLSDDGVPVAACQSVPVTQGEATCTATVGTSLGGHSLSADYSGDGGLDPSTALASTVVKDATTTTAAAAGDGPFDPRGAIVYRAVVTPALGGRITSDAGARSARDPGTVAFSVDGAAVAACAARPVDDGVATCATTAPVSGAAHVVGATYSGGAHHLGSAGEGRFALKTPGAALPATATAGRVAVGGSGTVRVTLTSAGSVALRVTSVTIGGGAFAIAADRCSGAAVAPGATCVVDVAFKPVAAGAQTATLTFADDAPGAPHAVTLTGTGTARPVGAGFAPGHSTTLSVAGGSVTIPLRCPPAQPCAVAGTLAGAGAAPAARAARATSATIARFSRTTIGAGKVKRVKLRLDPAFVRQAGRRGVRRIGVTLTVDTRLAGGERVATRRRVTLVFPAVRGPRFTG